MPRLLDITYSDPGTPYALIRKLDDRSQVWNGTAFVTWDDAGLDDYDVELANKGGDAWSEEFPEDIESGDYHVQYKVRTEATPELADDSLDSEEVHWDGSGLSDPAEDPTGVYYSWAGIKNILGQLNAEIASQLDNNVTAADLARVEYDGEIADAETNRRARIRGLVTPITAASADFILVQQATDLYASWMLVQHREWFENVGRLTDEQMAGLEKRYLDAYRRLFGADDEGIDAEEDSDDETPSAPGTFQTVPMTFEPVCDTDEDAA